MQSYAVLPHGGRQWLLRAKSAEAHFRTALRINPDDSLALECLDELLKAKPSPNCPEKNSEGAAVPLLLNQGLCLVSAQRGLVAQICNLPYRRFVIGRASESWSALALADVPQNAILRYSRLQSSLR